MRKVFKNGNSLAVTVPKSYAHQLSIRDGSKIEWKETAEGLLLVHEQRVARKPSEIDPEVARLIKKLSKKYSGVWQDLSRV
ncbi:AbrB/MazE/SpoVT family DNA-binding domain-containing protein [Candidatus Daviesbacteria bacterium]|nr:AbrB/MazE/SpoVT family DNA-binding domain-containing protein [Candidatus Daviesbacteria bacterium]